MASTESAVNLPFPRGEAGSVGVVAEADFEPEEWSLVAGAGSAGVFAGPDQASRPRRQASGLAFQYALKHLVRDLLGVGNTGDARIPVDDDGRGDHLDTVGPGDVLAVILSDPRAEVVDREIRHRGLLERGSSHALDAPNGLVGVPWAWKYIGAGRVELPLPV